MVHGMRIAVLREARNEEGQALVEYALVLALIAVVALGSLTLVGTNVAAILGAVQAVVAAAIPGG
jgi:pilus assembly protein Flp/PilA